MSRVTFFGLLAAVARCHCEETASFVNASGLEEEFDATVTNATPLNCSNPLFAGELNFAFTDTWNSTLVNSIYFQMGEESSTWDCNGSICAEVSEHTIGFRKLPHEVLSPSDLVDGFSIYLANSSTCTMPEVMRGLGSFGTWQLLGYSISYTIDLRHVECGCNAGVSMVTRTLAKSWRFCEHNCVEIVLFEANAHDNVGAFWFGPRTCRRGLRYSTFGINARLPMNVSTSFDRYIITTTLTQNEASATFELDAKVEDQQCSGSIRSSLRELQSGMVLAISNWQSRSTHPSRGIPKDRATQCECISSPWTLSNLAIRALPLSAAVSTPAPTPAPASSRRRPVNKQDSSTPSNVHVNNEDLDISENGGEGWPLWAILCLNFVFWGFCPLCCCFFYTNTIGKKHGRRTSRRQYGCVKATLKINSQIMGCRIAALVLNMLTLTCAIIAAILLSSNDYAVYELESDPWCMLIAAQPVDIVMFEPDIVLDANLSVSVARFSAGGQQPTEFSLGPDANMPRPCTNAVDLNSNETRLVRRGTTDRIITFQWLCAFSQWIFLRFLAIIGLPLLAMHFNRKIVETPFERAVSISVHLAKALLAVLPTMLLYPITSITSHDKEFPGVLAWRCNLEWWQGPVYYNTLYVFIFIGLLSAGLAIASLCIASCFGRQRTFRASVEALYFVIGVPVVGVQIAFYGMMLDGAGLWYLICIDIRYVFALSIEYGLSFWSSLCRLLVALCKLLDVLLMMISLAVVQPQQSQSQPETHQAPQIKHGHLQQPPQSQQTPYLQQTAPPGIGNGMVGTPQFSQFPDTQYQQVVLGNPAPSFDAYPQQSLNLSGKSFTAVISAQGVDGFYRA